MSLGRKRIIQRELIRNIVRWTTMIKGRNTNIYNICTTERSDRCDKTITIKSNQVIYFSTLFTVQGPVHPGLHPEEHEAEAGEVGEAGHLRRAAETPGELCLQRLSSHLSSHTSHPSPLTPYISLRFIRQIYRKS